VVLINRDFTRLWAGQAVSVVGDFVFDTTLVLWVATVLLRGQPYAAAAVAAVPLCFGVATVLVGPIAGVFVDRWDRRRTMLVSDLVRAGLVGALTVVAFLPAGLLPVPATLAAIYAVVLLASAAAQFFNPARFALIGDVVTGDADRARAAGVGQATSAIAAIIGPPLAAPLLFTVGVRWALLLNALSFLVSYAAVRSVQIAAPPHPAGTAPAPGRGMWRELGDGLRLVARSPLLRAIILTAMLVQLGTGAFNALGVFFVTENLRVSARFYGTLDMGLGIGLIGGSLAAGFVTVRLGSARVFWLGLLLVGAGLAVYTRLTDLVAAVVVLGLIGVPLAALNAAVGPLMLRTVPHEYVGRVMAIFVPSLNLTSITSAAVAGWLASTVLLGFDATIAGVRLGRIDTIFLVCAALIVAGAVYAGVALRGADEPATSAQPAPTR
jgi:MFS family permease